MSNTRPSTYEPGDIVDGYQWTGTVWAATPTFEPQPPGFAWNENPRRPWYRRPWLGVLAGMLGAIVIVSVFAGASEETPGDPSAGELVSTQNEAEQSEPEARVAPEITFDPVTYSGTGDTIQLIDAAFGGERAILTVTHTGDSNVVVWGLDDELETTGLLVNEIGPYEAATLIDADVRALKIQASGPWTITVAPLSDAPTFDDAIDGSGSAVVVYTGARGVAEFTHDGGTLVVWEHPESGYRHLSVMEFGPYNGEAVIGGGPNVLVIDADGDWSVDVR